MNNMKALTYTRYGNPDVLQLSEVDRPTPKDNEVLVKIHASSINPADWHYVTGLPYFMRLTAGLRRPKDPIPGLDLAGTVEAVGPTATRFAPGDRVYGEVGSAWAEYAALPETKLEPTPSNLSFAEAAAVPVAGLTAIQGLRNHGNLTEETGPGDGAGPKRVLINGASGGVGHFAVQIAKAYGAHVTGVCSTRNLDLVRSLGADRVIDYTVDDYTELGDRYDIVFDFAANRPLSAIRRVLADDAVYLPCSDRVGGKSFGPVRWMLGNMIAGKLRSGFSVKFLLAEQTHEDMSMLTELCESGAVRPILDKESYELATVADGLRAQETGRAAGKKSVVIQ
ncbi:MAG: NAD(P)-dependent alcohol dehydrogenase [Actinomycetota bacterium]